MNIRRTLTISGDPYPHEIVITPSKEERQQIVREYLLEGQIEDVKKKIEENIERGYKYERKFNQQDIRAIALKIDDSLSKCDLYWDAYWYVVDNCIDRYVKENKV